MPFILSSRRLDCISFQTTVLFSHYLFKDTHRVLLVFSGIVCWTVMWPPAASHLYCNAGQVYNPLLARATSHLDEHCGLPLSLEGTQWPPLYRTCSHKHQRPTHLLPKPNNSPVSPPASWCPTSLSCRCPLHESKGEQIEKWGQVMANHYSEKWCQQSVDLRGLRSKNVDLMTIRGKIHILDIIKQTEGGAKISVMS